MSYILYIIIIPCVLLSMVVQSLGVISLYRFKDVYMRMHGATKCSTLGCIFAVFAVIAYSLMQLCAGGGARFAVLILHVIAALFGLMIGNSTSAHVLARAAYRSGIKPKKAVVDAYAEFCKKELDVEMEEDSVDDGSDGKEAE